MRTPSAVTLALTAASVVMVALVHADPWTSTRAPAALLSTQSMARRLFPTLGEADLARATIRLRSARGELRLAPGDDGRWVGCRSCPDTSGTGDHDQFEQGDGDANFSDIDAA